MKKISIKKIVFSLFSLLILVAAVLFPWLKNKEKVAAKKESNELVKDEGQVKISQDKENCSVNANVDEEDYSFVGCNGFY